MKAKTVITALVCALFLASCGLFGSGGAARSALEMVAPIAADALAAMIKKRYGTDVDRDSAACFELPEIGSDEDGFEYILCRAKPVE